MRIPRSKKTIVQDVILRRSSRLQAVRARSTDSLDSASNKKVTKSVKSKSKEETKAPKLKSSNNSIEFKHGTLPRTYEEKKIKKGYKVVVGVDEAGRGPLAGPVVAAACFVPLHVHIEGIHDSKKLNEEQRELLYEKLVNHPDVKYAVHVNSPQRIDEINILQASLESMVKASEQLDPPADFVFVDGNRMPPSIKVEAETVIKGDSKVFSIAAASVIAKVTRDRLMVEYDKKYPMYGLAQHKGYPTVAHMSAISKHGPCEIHRMTFAPLRPKETTKKNKKK
jgi:ribonuclease HII